MKMRRTRGDHHYPPCVTDTAGHDDDELILLTEDAVRDRRLLMAHDAVYRAARLVYSLAPNLEGD